MENSPHFVCSNKCSCLKATNTNRTLVCFLLCHHIITTDFLEISWYNFETKTALRLRLFSKKHQTCISHILLSSSKILTSSSSKEVFLYKVGGLTSVSDGSYVIFPVPLSTLKRKCFCRVRQCREWRKVNILQQQNIQQVQFVCNNLSSL